MGAIRSGVGLHGGVSALPWGQQHLLRHIVGSCQTADYSGNGSVGGRGAGAEVFSLVIAVVEDVHLGELLDAYLRE